MTRRIPKKVSESSGLPQIRSHAIAINQLIDAIQAMDIKESPHVRIERTANGTTIHVKRGSAVSGADDTWY